MNKCQRCGYVQQKELPPLTIEEKVIQDLSYMMLNSSCKFAGLLEKDDIELDEVMRYMINHQFIVRGEDGFYVTDKGMEYTNTKAGQL